MIRFLDKYSEAWVLNNVRLYANSHVKLYIKVELLLRDFSKLDLLDVYQLLRRGWREELERIRRKGILILFQIFSRDVLQYYFSEIGKFFDDPHTWQLQKFDS